MWIWLLVPIYIIFMATSETRKKQILIKFLFFSHTFRNNKIDGRLCNYTHLYPYKSTKEDVVFFYSTVSRIGIVLSIVSLRYAAKDCRIIFFITQGSALLSSTWIKFMIDNNIEIEILKGNNTLMYTRPNCYRFIAEQKWLHEHGKEVKRIFHSDSADVFFPENPFVALSSEILYYIGETKKVNENNFNKDWIVRCGGEEALKKFGNSEVINSGSIGGSAAEYIKFLDYMLETSLWKKCILIGASFDQPVLTILFHGGNLTNVVKYRKVGVLDGFISMTLNPPKITNNEFRSWYNHKEIYMHQYNRFGQAIKYLFDLCYVKSYDVSNKKNGS